MSNSLLHTTRFLVLAILVVSAHTAVASEVTGTLSSDGSSSLQPAQAQDSDTALSGSVVGGTEDPATAVLAASSQSTDVDVLVWLLALFGLVIVVSVGYSLYLIRQNRPTT